MPTTTKTTKPLEKKEDSVLGEDTLLSLNLPWEQANIAYKAVLAKEATKVQLPGFRKGKAPLSLVESALNPQKLWELAINKELPALYEKAVKEAGIIPLASPHFELKDTGEGKDFIIQARTAVAPEIKLGEYQKGVKTAIEDAQKEWAKHAEEAGKDHVHVEDEEKNAKLQAVFVKLIEQINPKIAPALLQEEMSHQLENVFSQLSQINKTLPEYLKEIGKSEDEFRDELAATSLRSLQLEFILRAITEDLKIEVTAEDRKAWLKDSGFPENQPINEKIEQRIDPLIIRKKTVDALVGLS